MPILWLEQDHNGWAAPGWTGPPGKCLVYHITPQYMGGHDWGQFHPFQASIQGSRGPEMPILWLEQDQNGWAAPGWTSPPGKCLVRHISITELTQLSSLFLLKIGEG